MRTFDLLRWVFAVAQAYAWWVGPGAVLILSTAAWLLSEYPRTSAVAIFISTVMLVSVLWGEIFIPKPGSPAPPWWAWWYANPLRKVAWRFGCVLDVHDLPARGFVVGAFQTSFKVNRDRIVPKRLFVESATGKTVDLLIQCGPKYLRADQIKYIPAGNWVLCLGRILRDQSAPDEDRTNHPSREEFFRLYDELTIVLEYDNREFRKHFSRSDLRRMIDVQIAVLSPNPARLPVPKTAPSGPAASDTHSEPEVEFRHIARKTRDVLAGELRQRGFGDALKDYSVDIRHSDRAECAEFARELASLLGLAGWSGEPGTTFDERTEPEIRGLHLCLEDMDAKPPTANMLAAVLRDAGIDFRWLPWPGLKNRMVIFVYPQKR
jgi:hypothetical protein